MNDIERDKINNFLSAIHGAITFDVIKYDCIYSDDRKVYRVSVNEINYIYKTCGTSKKSIDEFELEFQIMTSLFTSSKSNISMPEPLLLVEGLGFLMSECKGRVLKDIYYKSILPYHSVSQLRNSVIMSASWLGTYHVDNLVSDHYDHYYSNRLSHFKRMVDSIKGFNITVSTQNSLDLALTKYMETEFSVDVPISILHGNFAMRNILSTENNVCLIDFEDSKTDVIYFDIGMFIAELLNKSIYKFNNRLTNNLIINFTDKYSSIIKLDNALVEAYVLYHLVWSYYEVMNRKSPKSLIKSIVLSYKKKHALKMISRVVSGKLF